MAGSRAASADRRPGRSSLATPNAAPVASRLVSTPAAASSGACSANSSSRNPSAEHDPDHQRRLRREQACRSLFSATAPPRTAPAGSLARSRSIVAADRRAGGILARDRGDQDQPAAAGLGRHQRAIPGSSPAMRATEAASDAGATICSGPVAPGPSRPAPGGSRRWRSRVAGTTLIEGIDVRSCVTGRASASSSASAGMP